MWGPGLDLILHNQFSEEVEKRGEEGNDIQTLENQTTDNETLFCETCEENKE